jgi:hypothetical protein
VPEARIAGTIAHVIPSGGRVMRFIGQPLVTVIVIAIPVALLFGWDALRKTLSKRKEETPVNNESPTEADENN